MNRIKVYCMNFSKNKENILKMKKKDVLYTCWKFSKKIFKKEVFIEARHGDTHLHYGTLEVEAGSSAVHSHLLL